MGCEWKWCEISSHFLHNLLGQLQGSNVRINYQPFQEAGKRCFVSSPFEDADEALATIEAGCYIPEYLWAQDGSSIEPNIVDHYCFTFILDPLIDGCDGFV